MRDAQSVQNNNNNNNRPVSEITRNVAQNENISNFFCFLFRPIWCSYSHHWSTHVAHRQGMDFCSPTPRTIANHFSNAKRATRIKFHAAKVCCSTIEPNTVIGRIMCSAENQRAVMTVTAIMAIISRRYEYNVPHSFFAHLKYVLFRIVSASLMEQCSRIIKVAAKSFTFVIMVDTLNHVVKDDWCSTSAFALVTGHKMWNALVTINALAIQGRNSGRQSDQRPKVQKQIHRSNIDLQTNTATTIIIIYRCLFVHHNLVRPKIVCCNRAFHTMNFIINTINCNSRCSISKINKRSLMDCIFTIEPIIMRVHLRRNHPAVEILLKLRKFSHSDSSRKIEP